MRVQVRYRTVRVQYVPGGDGEYGTFNVISCALRASSNAKGLYLLFIHTMNINIIAIPLTCIPVKPLSE